MQSIYHFLPSPPPHPRVEAALARWLVTGLEQQGAVPSLIASVDESASSLLNVRFELNPEDSAADQLLHVHSQPVEIIYDAVKRGTDRRRGGWGGCRYCGWKSMRACEVGGWVNHHLTLLNGIVIHSTHPYV